MKRFWKKYTVFSGRASRSEYWWWALVSISISIVINIITAAALIGLVPFLGAIALLVLVLMPSNPAGQHFDQPGSM